MARTASLLAVLAFLALSGATSAGAAPATSLAMSPSGARAVPALRLNRPVDTLRRAHLTVRAQCRATAPDSLGPFYEPGAPVRSRVGTGYVLRGRVLSAANCLPIRRARIEFWLVNPQGEYDDAHRATVVPGRTGRYRFQSNRPVGYGGRPPHIHVRVTARGYRALVTQHYPRGSRTSVVFNLVLRRG